LTNAQFRADFPEFANTTVYSDATVTLWMGVGVARLNAARWNAMGLYNIGLELFTAHFVVLAIANQRRAAAGEIPGQDTTVKASKAAGPVSAGIDTTISSDVRAGSWNLTDYGKRFHEMAMIVGIAGAQVSGPDMSGLDSRDQGGGVLGNI
jgi:hypothetical protein